MADTDLAELRKQCITSLYLCADNVSKYLDQEKEAEFDSLKAFVEEYCLIEAQQDVAMQALDKAKRETEVENVDTLENRFSSHLQRLAGKKLNVNRHPYMLELTKRIEKGKELARQNLDESDLAITESQDRYIDPITKKPIENPVKNTVCGHVYEKNAVEEMIKLNQRTKCPVAGCANREPIQGHLINDDELKFRMAITQHSTMIQDKSTMDLDDTV